MDESEILGLVKTGARKGAGSGSKAQGNRRQSNASGSGNVKPKGGKKEPKTFDPNAHRVKAATKIFPHLKFIQASLIEICSKAETFMNENEATVDRAREMIQRGVTADKLSDPVLELGDEVASFQLLFVILNRYDLVKLMSTGVDKNPGVSVDMTPSALQAGQPASACKTVHALNP